MPKPKPLISMKMHPLPPEKLDELIATAHVGIFNFLCARYPKKKGEYKALLKMYNGDHRQTVVAIESALLQEEAKNPKKS